MNKTTKRALAILLAVVLLAAAFPTSVFAAQAGEQSAEAVSQPVREPQQRAKNHVPLPQRTAAAVAQAVRDNAPAAPGSLTLTPSVNPGLDLKQNAQGLAIDVPAYEADEVVRVIVEFESASLLERGFTSAEIASVDAARVNAGKTIRSQQEAVLRRIGTAVASFSAGEGGTPDAPAVDVNYHYDVIFSGVSINIPYGALDAVRNVSGVASAFVAPQYDLPDDIAGDAAQPMTAASAGLTGKTLAWDAGYTGEGMKIAIIDTGLDICHESFSAAGFPATGDSLTEARIGAVLGTLNAAEAYSGLTASDLYISEKIPYGFCYVDRDLDVTHADGMGDHGTHVAGIAAANRVEGIDVAGVAPDAQILVMKVFGDEGGAYMDDIAAALEDCFRLGVDAVNMSLGSPAGFSTAGSAWEDSVYAAVAGHGMILAVAAGNSGSAAAGNATGTNYNRTEDPDNGIIASPATYAGATAVASMENSSQMLSGFLLGGETIPYTDVASSPFTDLTWGMDSCSYEYVMVPGYGTQEDFNSLAETLPGRVAVVQRGVIAFTEKQANASNAGASAVIVYDNVEGSLINMEDAGYLPNIFVSRSSGGKLAAAAGENGVGTLTVLASCSVEAENEAAGRMSDFSSWGVSPDLTLTPDITAPGGHIYSTLDGGAYGDMSGTSMASPQVAGMSALVLQYLRQTHRGLSDRELHTVAEALLMSTATPIEESEGLPYSPRWQGAGLANVYSAVTSPAYLTVGGSGELTPKVSLGDDASRNGVYEFTFDIHNFSGSSVTYDLEGIVLTDQYQKINGVEYMGETGRLLSGGVTFSAGTVTVPGGGVETVTVTVTLSQADKNYMDAHYKNGIYVDGFVRLIAREGSDVDLGLPFMGFYGDWSDAKVFDTGWWYETDEEISYDRYPHVIFTSYGAGSYYVLGLNPYADTPYDEAHNAVSPNGDTYIDGLENIYIGLMRSARELSFVWTDSDGNELDRYEYDHAGKNYLNESYQIIFPFMFADYVGADKLYDFTDADGNVLPDGTTVYLTVSAWLDDGDDLVDDEFTVPVTIDVEAPEIVRAEAARDENGRMKLTLEVRDNQYIAAVVPISAAGAPYAFYTAEDYRPGDVATFEIDITGYDAIFQLAVTDYACNETYYTVTLGGAAELDPDSWYGYRHISWLDIDYGNGYVYSYGSGDYNGWYSFREAGSMVWRDVPVSDEDRNVTAAEYVDGYVIAIDEAGGIFAMKAGSWTRMPIGELVVDGNYCTAVDMAFDYSTDTLYVLTDGIYDWMSGTEAAWLAAIDPLTGETLRAVAVSGVETQLLTLAAGRNGKLYTVDTDVEDATLYTIDKTTGAATPVGKTGVATGYEKEDDSLWAWDVDQDGDVDAADVQLLLDAYNGKDGMSLEDLPYYYWGIYDYTGDGKVDTADAQYLYTQLDDLPKPDVEGFYQSMAYDHDANELYWITYLYYTDPGTSGDVIASGFYKVDTATGKAGFVSGVQYRGEMAGLFKPYDNGSIIPDHEDAAGLVLTMDAVSMTVGGQAILEALPVPYYASLSGLTWTSSDEEVAIVEDGLVTAVGEGEAVITAALGDQTASCAVKVISVAADLVLYDGLQFQWIGLNASKPERGAYSETGISPAYAITAAAYRNGTVYAYDYSGNFYALDPGTLSGGRLGSANAHIMAMAFNYVDGYMYGLEEKAENNGWGVDYSYNLVRINLNNGAVKTVAALDAWELGIGSFTYGMAIGYDGTFYLAVTDYEYNHAILKCSLDGEALAVDAIASTGVGFSTGYTSLVYSDANDGLFWADDWGRLIWIGIESLEPVYLGSVMNLEAYGSSMNMGLVELLETEPSVPEIPAASAGLPEKIQGLVGGSVSAGLDVQPWNSTSAITYTVEHPEIAAVDDNGIITGIETGTTTLTVEIDGLDPLTAQLVVLASAGALSGFAVQDYDGRGLNFWIEIPDTVPEMPAETNLDLLESEITVFAGTYYDGVIYAFGQGGEALNYRNYFMTFDAKTYDLTILDKISYSVRDMAFDYTTGVLYAVATTGELLQLDTASGYAVAVGNSGTGWAAVTVDEEGQLYAISTDGVLCKLDKTDASAEEVGETSLTDCNGYQSMHCDLNTGNVYWAYTSLDPASGGLYLVDLSTGAATELGSIGDGTMVAALYTVPDSPPALPERVEPAGVRIDSENQAVAVGERLELSARVLPLIVAGVDMDDTLTWDSSDDAVATVAGGVVTGVSAGTVTITATDAKGHYGQCTVSVTENRRLFYAYDEDSAAWVSFDADGETTVIRADQDGEVPLKASVYVPGLDTIYAFDAEGGFYGIDPDTFERTKLGQAKDENGGNGFGLYDEWGDGQNLYPIVPVDMAYDSATGTLYLAAQAMQNNEWGYYGPYSFIYEVNPASGGLTMAYGTYSGVSNLYVTGGLAYFIDCRDTGLFTQIDLAFWSETQLAMVPGYWSEPTSSRGYFLDELTDTFYVVRDFAGGGYGGNGGTPEPILYVFSPSDGDLIQVCAIGGGYVNGVFIR